MGGRKRECESVQGHLRVCEGMHQDSLLHWVCYFWTLLLIVPTIAELWGFLMSNLFNIK